MLHATVITKDLIVAIKEDHSMLMVISLSNTTDTSDRGITGGKAVLLRDKEGEFRTLGLKPFNDDLYSMHSKT